MDIYTDIRGTLFGIAGLEADERALIDRLLSTADAKPEWTQFRNFYIVEVDRFYSAKGLSRRQILETVGWRIGSDLTSRLGISQGQMRLADYRGQLEMLIFKNFPTRKAFCDATGLSEDMLSHVLARRKHFAIDTLNDALAKIGYTLRIAPLPNIKAEPEAQARMKFAANDS